jgi:hypothetical protein
VFCFLAAILLVMLQFPQAGKHSETNFNIFSHLGKVATMPECTTKAG